LWCCGQGIPFSPNTIPGKNVPCCAVFAAGQSCLATKRLPETEKGPAFQPTLCIELSEDQLQVFGADADSLMSRWFWFGDALLQSPLIVCSVPVEVPPEAEVPPLTEPVVPESVVPEVDVPL
jgi:hypothetical protein